ncbi:MAG: rod shape-determining protein [Victivallaceae bacterium]|nr:rod shape-determining protein [Victivallaceae bacterium]
MTTYIDFGSHVVRYLENGAVFQEPSLIADDADSCKVLGFGDHAEQLSLNPELALTLSRPLIRKEYPDMALLPMLRYFRAKMRGSDFVFVLPDFVDEAGQQNLRETLQRAGFTHVRFTPILQTLHRYSPENLLLIHCGARRTHLGIAVGGEQKISRSLLWGGNSIDTAIKNAVRQKDQLQIGSQSLRLLKKSLSDVSTRMVRGVDALSGLPRNAELRLADYHGTVLDEFAILGETVRSCLPHYTGGHIKITGGMANCKLLLDYLRQELKLFVVRDPHPELALLHAMEADQ